MPVNKITWRQVGGVSEPGRYMYTFGWLTITADDLAVWEKHPNAAFTLIGCASTAEAGNSTAAAGEEFRLGSFELRESPSVTEK
jgi:hypothetical protein